MLGLQVLFLAIFFFLIGAETAAPGVAKSVITAAAEVSVAAHDQTYRRLCTRVQLHGRPSCSEIK